ncbi:hypothetical protein DFP72DRAFT_1059660 [Ephemerocybe angulata]|uniref:Cyclin N-terminal domain-containing protein n=1 Tax=Ephemerocybe angulata TaxID=980116 RepID=A0A8H6IG76_9AGAR|nr:hypothetical protein DFP72DRAFT_1059660 [Tulosesus angulatus]
MSSSSSSSSSPASSCSSSSSIHPASLVDASLHSPHTLRLVNIKITKQLIDHVVDQVIETVDYAMGKSTASPSTSASSSSSSPRGRPPTARTPAQLKFTTFVSTVLTRAEITTPTLLTSLLYITRARPYLHIALEEWALERVFLGALITASKYLNDSTLKNVHWALCTGVFGKRDVGRIEREFLAVLDWELGVGEGEVLGLWESLEWAVEMEEREERRVREREVRRMKEVALKKEREERERELQQSKLFFFSPPAKSHSRTSSTSSTASSSADLAVPPPLPRKSHHHHRAVPHHHHHHHHHSSSPSSASSSSSSSSLSSASSVSSSNSSSPRSPLTPADFDLAYPSAEELERMAKLKAQHVEDHDEHAMDVDAVDVPSGIPVVVVQPPQPSQVKVTATGSCASRRSVKRSFGATTMEILKNFPFPGHHHHHHHQHQQAAAC